MSNVCSSIAEGLASVECKKSNDPGVAPIMDMSAIMKLLCTGLQGVDDFDLHCP